jgi:hypothetical protein
MLKAKTVEQHYLIASNRISDKKANHEYGYWLYRVAMFTACLTANACNANNQNKQNTMKADISTLHVSPVVHDTLSLAQLEKIEFIHNTFAGVQPGTLEGTITDFKRDQNPDNEIAIWLSMANAYKKFVQKKGSNLDIAYKKETYKLILSRSSMSSKEAVTQAQPKLLSSADVSDIINFYDQAPEPIKVYRSE